MTMRNVSATGQRQPIAMWPLMIWAYRRHMVHYDADWYSPLESDGERSLLEQAQGDVPERSRTAHPDAHVVHRFVRSLPWAQASLLIGTAAKGTPPDWNPTIVPIRIVPAWKGDPGRVERDANGQLKVFGNVRRIYRRGNVVGHLVVTEGVPEEVAVKLRASARERYRVWWQGLRMVSYALEWGYLMDRWAVAGVGAPEEPWREVA